MPSVTLSARAGEVTNPRSLTSAAITHSALLYTVETPWWFLRTRVSLGMCHSRRIHLAALGRKAWTTKAGEGMEKEGHVQDSGRKKLKM